MTNDEKSGLSQGNRCALRTFCGEFDLFAVGSMMSGLLVRDVWLFAGEEEKGEGKKNEGTKNAAFFVPLGVHFLGVNTNLGLTRLAACGGSAILKGVFFVWAAAQTKKTPSFQRVVAAGHDEAVNWLVTQLESVSSYF